MSQRRANARHVALLATLIFVMPFIQPVSHATIQTAFTTITSYRVSGAPNYNTPGNESFWSQIGWTNISLVASVAPGGGKTPSVLVRSPNDGFNIYVLFRWKDAQGPSFRGDNEVFNDSSGGHILNPANTSTVNQLFYSSNYYYPDRAAMLWFIGNQAQRDQTAPQMQLGWNGAITNGTANIWHWQSNPTDNNPSDKIFPGGYNDPKGNPIYPPNNSSFAEDDYTNKTGFYPVAGNVSGTLNLDPYANPFMILAGTYFSAANKTWTVEMVRPLVVQQDARYRVQLTVGSTYFVGFAIWNGRMGESQHIKSVSQWYKLSVSNQAAPAAPAPTGGVSLTLATATGIGLLVTGLVVGLMIKPERKKPRQ